jgi:hypothetical protein
MTWVTTMLGPETYVLEYWIDSSHLSKAKLEEYVKNALGKFIQEIRLEFKENGKYLILRISSVDKFIDGCHEKLDFDREWSFRARDELGELLRAEAYPVLAEIELWLRNFITRAMIDSLGFDWWDSFISENIREKVRDIEKKSGKNQIKLHHPIEFTFFEDLIEIVTTEFQAWSSDQSLTVDDFFELLSACNSFEEIQREIENRRKVVSFWDDVFSIYFDDKNSWDKLKKDINTIIVPIRNKVMHHRLVRNHELRQLKAFRDELERLLGLAKDTPSERDLEDVRPSVKIITGKIRSQLDSEILKRARQSLEIDPEILKRARQSLEIDPEILKRARQSLEIDPEILKRARQSLEIDPE